MSGRGLTSGVREWRGRGESESFRGRRIHVVTRDGTDPPLVLLHGFPSSSYDWRGLLGLESERAALAFDFLGFGLSEKPRDGAVPDWDGPLAFAWGLRDPVATVAVLEALLELRPHAPTDRLGELGHYPQIEDPAAIAAALGSALARSTEAA